MENNICYKYSLAERMWLVAYYRFVADYETIFTEFAVKFPNTLIPQHEMGLPTHFFKDANFFPENSKLFQKKADLHVYQYELGTRSAQNSEISNNEITIIT